MTNILRSCAIGLVLVAIGCTRPSIAGSGKIVTEPRSVSGFSKVSLSGTGQLIIEQTGSESLTITADDNLLPYLTSDVDRGELQLRTKGSSLDPSRKIVYEVTVKTLEDVTIGGSVSVEATKLDADRLAVTLGGEGDITLAGRAHTLAIVIAGDGRYHGDALKTERATINIAGSGRAVVAASETLDVTVAGDGTVEYIGNPTVTRQVLGSGSVRQR